MEATPSKRRPRSDSPVDYRFTKRTRTSGEDVDHSEISVSNRLKGKRRLPALPPTDADEIPRVPSPNVFRMSEPMPVPATVMNKQLLHSRMFGRLREICRYANGGEVFHDRNAAFRHFRQRYSMLLRVGDPAVFYQGQLR
jgi:hypothetical protein